MDCLPDHLVWEILNRINKTADRNSVSLTSKCLNKLEGEQRKFIRVGCSESLACICNRFPYLEKVEIVYSGLISRLGKQLDDQGLQVLSNNCLFLTDLTLSCSTFITDAGISSLASCSKLTALKLDYAPRITGCGILSLVMGCNKLTVLHLVRCPNISSVEWLEYLGNLGTLEDLCIDYCGAIKEGDLAKLGSSWGTLKRLQFEVDVHYMHMKSCDRLAVDSWQKQCFPCISMQELSLANCIISPGRGLASVLGKCNNLEKIHLNMCVGLRDSDIICLAENARSLRSISLRIYSYFFSSNLLVRNPVRLTDKSLKALAQNCSRLDSFRICFTEGESFSSFTLDGIITLIQSCPIRELDLGYVDCFDDVGMDALRSAKYLEVLEIVGCQEVTDEGLQHVGQFPRLRVLGLRECFGVSDDGLKLLRGACKLELLSVEDCPQISEQAVQGCAKSIFFRQDLSYG